MIERPNGIDVSQPSNNDTLTDPVIASSSGDNFAVPQVPKKPKPKQKSTTALKATVAPEAVKEVERRRTKKLKREEWRRRPILSLTLVAKKVTEWKMKKCK